MNEWSVEKAVCMYFADDHEDGDLLSHDWILYALDMPEVQTREDSLKLLDRMEAFRKALLKDHNIALQNVRGKGYRVVPPSEQAEYAARIMASHITKGMTKANSLLTHTRTETLTDAECRRHTDTQIRVAGLRDIIGKGKRDVFALFEPGK